MQTSATAPRISTLGQFSTTSWIGIPKHILRPRERTPWSLPAASAPATLCAPAPCGSPAAVPGGPRRCVAGAGQAPQAGGGSASGVLESDGLGKDGWGGSRRGRFTLRYDPTLASKMLLKGVITQRDHATWKRSNRVPDHAWAAMQKV